MTIEQLGRAHKLLDMIEEYEERIEAAEKGEIVLRWDGCEKCLTEDIFSELIIAQLKKDLAFLKERFESL